MDSFSIFLAGTVQFQQQPSQTQQGLTQAQQPQSFANYMYDPTTGYYYDSTTGLYYDANTQVILLFVKSTLLLITITGMCNLVPISPLFLFVFFYYKHICHCFCQKHL